MINHVQIPNFPFQTLERSILTDAVTSGDTTISVQNSQGFSAEKFLVFGDGANEKTEAKEIESVDTDENEITVAAVDFGHEAEQTVYMTPYNQIKLYKAEVVDGVDPDIEDYTLLATFDIDFEQLLTLYEDSGATTARRYRFKYFNSVSEEETELADGYAENVLQNTGYCSVAYVQNLLRMNSNAALIAQLIDAASDFIDTACESHKRLYIQEVTEFLDTKAGKRTYFPKNKPIQSVVSATVMDEYGQEQGAYEYLIHSYPQYIKLQYTLSTIAKGLKLVTNVGYFEYGNVPKDLELLCARLVISEYKRYQNNQDPTVQSKKIGNYSITFNKESLSSEMVNLDAIISKYRGGDVRFMAI